MAVERASRVQRYKLVQTNPPSHMYTMIMVVLLQRGWCKGTKHMYTLASHFISHLQEEEGIQIMLLSSSVWRAGNKHYASAAHPTSTMITKSSSSLAVSPRGPTLFPSWLVVVWQELLPNRGPPAPSKGEDDDGIITSIPPCRSAPLSLLL